MYTATFYNYPEHPTINNTDKWYYNCGGYALSTFKWYLPAASEDAFRRLERLVRAGKYDEALERAVKHMLREFKELVLVDSRMVYQKKIDYRKFEIIAFRWEENPRGDFHFMKLARNGNWYDKCGSSSRIKRHSYFEVFDTWGDRYDGPIAFMIRPR